MDLVLTDADQGANARQVDIVEPLRSAFEGHHGLPVLLGVRDGAPDVLAHGLMRGAGVQKRERDGARDQGADHSDAPDMKMRPEGGGQPGLNRRWRALPAAGES
jgi:hypothetical protein